MENQDGITYKGVNYDTGTNYTSASLSRDELSTDTIQREMRIIKNELHCNSVRIFGTDIKRLIECSDIALENDLSVWLSPRLINANVQETLDYISIVSQEAEKLRRQYLKVNFVLGCEFTLDMYGIVSGNNIYERTLNIFKPKTFIMNSLGFDPGFNKKLNDFLGKARSISKSNFKGNLTYGAGIWEKVIWNEFDIVGLNYYKAAFNESNYARVLRKQHKYNKPIAILEFGCCSYVGADKKGPAGYDIIDNSKATPELKGEYIRNEKVQSDYLLELLNIYKAENIYGAFIFLFNDPKHRHNPDDPRQDLDMASFSIVKVYPSGNEKSYESGYWEPKMAFEEIAKFYESN